jgi:hypothetical protein
MTKTFEGKQYHINCAHHPDQWVCHTTAECNSKPDKPAESSGATSGRRLKAAKLTAATLEAEGETSEDPSSEEEGDEF